MITVVNDIDPEVLVNKGKLLDVSFAEDGHPISGIAYWRYFVSKYKGKLYVVEYTATKDGTEHVVKHIDY